MFYEPKDGHGLPHNPFNAIVTPRPIAWVSTRGEDGTENLAPHSFFNAVAYVPPQVIFSSTGAKPDRGDTKDSVANIRSSGVFCVNIVGLAMKDVMNRTSGPWPKETDEFADAGIARDECRTIPCSRVLDAPAALECVLADIVTLRGRSNFLVIGEVTGVHIRDDVLKDGMIDYLAYRPLARLGYRDYTDVDHIFSLNRPGQE